MKSSMRAFGIGIFLAGASVALYNQYAPTDEAKEQKAYEQQIEQYEAKITELEKQLEQTSEKTEAETKEATKTITDSTEIEQTEELKESKKDGDVVSATIYIYEDMSLYSIGQQVEDEGIISNGRELELYLSKPEYSRSIQKGAFDLSSTMTIEQIAAILTGKKN